MGSEPEPEHVPAPWEALDLDDSDLSTFLHPHSQLFLKPCSRRSLPSQISSTSSSLHQTPQSEPFRSSSPPSRLIPGPAGAVQMAMQRRTLGDRGFFGRDSQDTVPTQEFIRRIVENGDDLDVDFASNSWLCALNFIRRQGLGEGNAASQGTSLSSIKNSPNSGKVSLVIAIIKSCAPNGLGDVMVTLKDPTGTIGASIHRRVFTEGDFVKDISVGAVLVIQKVAVFSPSHCTHYLNITPSNVIKIIPKDSGPPVKEQHCEPSLRHPAPVTESRERSVFSTSQERTAGILNNLRQTKFQASGHDERESDEATTTPTSNGIGNNGRSRNQSVGKENEVLSEIATHNTFNEINDIDSNPEVVMSEQPKDSEKVVNMVKNAGDEDEGRKNGVNSTMQLKWTDEQLDELLAFD